MKRLLLLVLILSSLLQIGNAQNTGSITGFVVDKATQQPLEGASVKLEGSDKGTVADNAGKFRIANIAAKSYNLEISKVGYKTFILYNIVVNSGNENTYTIELEQTATALTELVIKANTKQKVYIFNV